MCVIRIRNSIKAVVIMTAFFVSCDTEYSADDLLDLSNQKDSLSVEVAEQLKIVYTDSGALRAKIFAPLMKRYPTATDPYTEMPKGLEAHFYNELEEIQSSLTANYAINYENKDFITIRDSVRVINKLDEEIKTDELNWDKKERKIYSDKHVRIRVRDEKVLLGEGFESNETFTKYTIKKLTGTIRLNETNETKEQ